MRRQTWFYDADASVYRAADGRCIAILGKSEACAVYPVKWPEAEADDDTDAADMPPEAPQAMADDLGDMESAAHDAVHSMPLGELLAWASRRTPVSFIDPEDGEVFRKRDVQSIGPGIFSRPLVREAIQVLVEARATIVRMRVIEKHGGHALLVLWPCDGGAVFVAAMSLIPGSVPPGDDPLVLT